MLAYMSTPSHKQRNIVPCLFCRQDLSVATGQISELFGRIRDIQRKASDTELLVQEICRDIRKLDYAKRHLTHTITSLRRLAMLTAAVNDLEQVMQLVAEIFHVL